ncbi:hypothetical protein OOK43_07815 [[Kitasatospora] papulosa]|jgi:hypothetical protein|uniref:hypothetical protein n=1 Tax=Streptomyces TaxID=1883 RepID=UPI00081BAC31|nr:MULTISPECIES: hypothetical protein [Streptomyces]MCX4413193.1 hypothetical protein [[Kitasatospora] papulosa]MYX86793.1 hypothetical protein [Streptomyces sp. SID4915]SCD92581.1 hypothetical protein GA0115250_129045 [Streptomyces sp. BvitLS-983]
MNRRSTGHWVPTSVAAEWLGEPHTFVRLFAFHCRVEGKLPEAVHHDKTMHPATALNTEHIYEHWGDWSAAYAAWRRRRH